MRQNQLVCAVYDRSREHHQHLQLKRRVAKELRNAFETEGHLFIWENIVNPTVYLTLRPIESVRLEAFYRAYWLASDSDVWAPPGFGDPEGRSGSFVGQEIDLRVRHQLTRRLGLDMGYAHFMPGNFVRNTVDSADDSDFFYVQLTWRF